MKIKKLNPLKNRIFAFLTSSMRNSKNLEALKTIPKNTSIKILISRPNHRLGNQLLITPLLQELTKQFPNCKIHLVVNGTLSNILFSQYDAIEKVYHLPKKPFNNIFNYIKTCINLISNRFDIAFVACEDSNSGKIFVRLSKAKYKIYDSGGLDLNKPLHLAKYPIYNLNRYLNPDYDLKNYEYPKLSIKLTEKEKQKGKQTVNELFNNSKRTICIFTFATGNKCHSKDWWAEFYKTLKAKFSDYNILEMLPKENVSQIDFKSTHYYSKDLREIAAIFENCAIFIGADSGMMHLSAATNTTTLGLFNVTNSDVYEPYGGLNQAINTNITQIDEIIDITTKALNS